MGSGIMRVLWICPRLPTPGSPGSMAATARQLESLRELGLEFTVMDMRGIPVWKYVQAIPRVLRAARHVDLIHAHFGYCGWLASVARRRPVVVSFMGDDLLGTPNRNGSVTHFSRWMVRSHQVLASHVQAVIVKSQEMARIVAPVVAHVIPNGVDTARFAPLDREEVRDHLGWPRTALRVLFPGNPQNPRKGFDLAVAATQVAERIVRRPVSLIPLWGVEPDDVPLYMNACDAMIMCSLIEGSPNVVKEAMACNVPIVASPVGDVAELLSGVPGYELGERHPQDLGQRLAQCLVESNGHDPQSRTEGRNTILARKLDLASIAERVVQVYRLALGEVVDQNPQVRSVIPTTIPFRDPGSATIAEPPSVTKVTNY